MKNHALAGQPPETHIESLPKMPAKNFCPDLIAGMRSAKALKIPSQHKVS
jgi:hypothetical protein